MRAPSFWNNTPQSPGLIARLLQPLGWTYAYATARRLRSGIAYRARVPVICIGNLHAGGTGKTPVVVAFCERLHNRGHKVFVVSRGYGGTIEGPCLVDAAKHLAAEVGDEPILLSNFAPTIVSKDRAAGVRLAESLGAEVIVLDDGFQNPSVHKDLSVIVVDAETGFGNGLCLPAGPLREPVSVGLKRANIVLTVGAPEAQARFFEGWRAPSGIIHLSGQLMPLATGMDWQDARVIAFAGIARPEKFFATLRDLGAEVLRGESLADHQPLPDALLRRLELEAYTKGAQLVTTEKDAARLPQAFLPKVLVLVVRLQIAELTQLDAALTKLGL